jgi:uncharacterized damage-inducible protein DinB
MTLGVTMEELLVWNDEAAGFWKEHLEATPALLELPCGIGGAATVQDFVGHIWGVELRWSQRVASLPVTPRDELPGAPLEAVFNLHEQAGQNWRSVLGDAAIRWEDTITMDFAWLPPHARTISKRKAMAHALFHGQRHWAQLATLVRAGGSPTEFKGDLIFSRALP